MPASQEPQRVLPCHVNEEGLLETDGWVDLPFAFNEMAEQAIQTEGNYSKLCERIDALWAKDLATWTDEERAFMVDGFFWATSEMRRLTENVLRPAFGALLESMAVTHERLHRIGEMVLSEPGADDFHGPDFASYSHVDGLPGVSERCWADVWTPDANCGLECAPECENHGEYVACNGPAVNTLGTCANHPLA